MRSVVDCWGLRPREVAAVGAFPDPRHPAVGLPNHWPTRMGYPLAFHWTGAVAVVVGFPGALPGALEEEPLMRAGGPHSQGRTCAGPRCSCRNWDR